MVVEILKLQLRFSRVNRWAQRSQIATCLVSSQTEVESIPLSIGICQGLQSCLCSLELHLIVVRRYSSRVRSQPGIGLIAWCGNDEQCAAIHYSPEECQAITNPQGFLLRPIQRFLGALESMRFVHDPPQPRASDLGQADEPEGANRP